MEIYILENFIYFVLEYKIYCNKKNTYFVYAKIYT